ncbi:MAG: ORF6N domain-containing protein [Myxococcales bacterium]|nr:ORF6N domain-containing protein [Myxococcales bacterium]
MTDSQTTQVALISSDTLTGSILVIRGHKVMLDADLAALYGVETKALNQAVRRNIERFPDDFMFQLTSDEAIGLRSQTVTLKTGRGQHRKYLPFAFTEQGIAMLSSVLKSPRAIQVNIEIMRAFVRLRQMVTSNADLARKLNALERKYDGQFKIVFAAIREFTEPIPKKKGRPIGFRSDEE